MSSAPLLVFVKGGDQQVLAAAIDAIARWNSAVGFEVLRLVEKGTPGAIPIDKNPDIESPVEEAAAEGAFDMQGQFVPGGNGLSKLQVTGNAKGLRDPVTMAHELGHILGLAHPAPRSTFYHYHPTRVSTVAPIGLMGNGARGTGELGRPAWPAAPSLRARRDNGPSIGEIRYVRREFGLAPSKPPVVIPTDTSVGGNSPPPARSPQQI